MAGEGPGPAFLSRWPIHKTPALPSPDGTGRRLVFPTFRGSFLSKEGGAALSAKKVVGASFSELHLFYWLCVMDGLGHSGLRV